MDQFQDIVSRIDMSDVQVDQEIEFLGRIWVRGIQEPVTFTTQAYHSMDCLSDFLTMTIATTPFLHVKDVQGVMHMIRCDRVDHFAVELDEDDTKA